MHVNIGSPDNIVHTNSIFIGVNLANKKYD